MKMLRVVVVDSRAIAGDTVNELTGNQTLLLKNTPGWLRSFTSVVARTREPPTAKVVLGRMAAYSCRSVRSRIDWI
jgi:hypothetical protein